MNRGADSVKRLLTGVAVMASALPELTEAGLTVLRDLRDTTPNLGLRLWLTKEISEAEAIIARAQLPLPKPVRVYHGRKNMRRIKF
jgi:hypothetical protein